MKRDALGRRADNAEAAAAAEGRVVELAEGRAERDALRRRVDEAEAAAAGCGWRRRQRPRRAVPRQRATLCG